MLFDKLESPLITDGDRIREEAKRAWVSLRELAYLLGESESDLDFDLKFLSFSGEDRRQQLLRALRALIDEKHGGAMTWR